jgi:serine/threonine-protein kinase
VTGLVTVVAATLAIAPVAAAATIHTVAGNDRLAPLGDGGPATAAGLGATTDIEATADGGFLIAECSNNRVRRVSPAGVITTVAGSTKPAQNPAFNFGGDGGPRPRPSSRVPSTSPRSRTAAS